MHIDSLIMLLGNHHSFVYIVLFFGSYFETLIGTSFLVYGEFFFLAGAILAGIGKVNLWVVMIALYGGALLGDHSSYWIGRHWGNRMYIYLQNKFFFRRFFTTSNYSLGTKFFTTYGGRSVFTGRFLGPISWITPFIAGVFKLPYIRFTIFDFFGVILGIGQFLVVGYIFGKNYQTMLAISQQYILIGLFIGAVMLIIGYYYRRLLRRLDITVRHSILHYMQHLYDGDVLVIKKSIRVLITAIMVILILYMLSLFILFFVANQRLNGTIAPDLRYTFNSIDEVVRSIDSTTYYKDGTTDIGPINVVIITNHPLGTVLTEAGWVRNKTLIRDKVGFLQFLDQAKNNVFPISDLYFKGVPQNYAYQFRSSTLTTREHIRIWNYGLYNNTHIYLVSASKDIGFDFYRSMTFLVPFHSLDTNIDTSRNLLEKSIMSKFNAVQPEKILSTLGMKDKKSENEELYYTDGLITVLEL